jgi:hypothetical protein
MDEEQQDPDGLRTNILPVLYCNYNAGMSVRCMLIAITMTKRAKIIKELTKSK